MIMERKFETMNTYIMLAKKIISKFGPQFYPGLAKEMLHNEEAISDIATAIMNADWKYDPDKPTVSGKKKTLYSYRNQCGLWAIKTYVTNKYKNSSRKISLDYSIDDKATIVNNIVDHKNQSPALIAEMQETEANLHKDIYKLLNIAPISDRQKDQIKLYYLNGLTLSQIGKHYDISREAVRQNIKRGLNTIKKYDKVTN
jgi:RNA polymerase sigma factor (sigma-70 family)